MSASFSFLVVIILTNIYTINSECNTYDTTCIDEDTGKYCSQVYSEVDYQLATSILRKHICNSKEFCQWSSMWNNTCVTAGIAKNFHIYYSTPTSCLPITVPIILNVTISCCSPHNQKTDTCTSINSDIRYNFNYIQDNCVSKPYIAAVLEGVIDCYATTSFLTYLQCNSTSYENTCPLYLFNQLQYYAKCSCSHIVEMDTLYSLGGDSYKYFTDLTDIIEAEMQAFGNWEENCPNYVFSCNSDGDALLDLYEILCPFEFEEWMQLDGIKLALEESVSAQSDEQVEMYERWDKVRVLMYSETEAWNAMDYLWSGDSIIPNNGSECVMQQTQWNLKYSLPTYSEPTLEPTVMPTQSDKSNERSEDESDIALIIVLVCVGILILICIVVGVYVYRKRRKRRDTPPITLERRTSDNDNVQLVQSGDTLDVGGEDKSGGDAMALPTETGDTAGGEFDE